MTGAELWTLMPLLLPAGGALLVLLSGGLMPVRIGTFIATPAALGVAAWVAMIPPPLAAERLGIMLSPAARLFIAVFAGITALSLLLGHRLGEEEEGAGEEVPATMLFALFGGAALAMSTNLLVLFLGLEALTFAFYFLVASDRRRQRSAEAGLKYLLAGAVAAAFTAFGLALIYAASGTLQTGAAMRVALSGANAVAAAGAGLLLAGMAFKVSLVPAHLWTPDVYQGAPTPVTAFLATLSKGAALVALLLLFAAGDGGVLRQPLRLVVLLSMMAGSLAALRQTSIKRLLAYSSIAHMGYAVLAILSGQAGRVAAAFYIVVYAAAVLAAFGALAAIAGEDGDDAATLAGSGFRRPFAGGVLALALLSLAGIPPTAGFMGKFTIFAAAIRSGEVWLAVAGILSAAIAAYYYLRVVTLLYLHLPGDTMQPEAANVAEYVALSIAAAAIVFLGLFPGVLLDVMRAVNT